MGVDVGNHRWVLLAAGLRAMPRGSSAVKSPASNLSGRSSTRRVRARGSFAASFAAASRPGLSASGQMVTWRP